MIGRVETFSVNDQRTPWRRTSPRRFHALRGFFRSSERGPVRSKGSVCSAQTESRCFPHANRLIEARFDDVSPKKRKESAFAEKRERIFLAKKRRNAVCRTGRFLLAEREKERPPDGFLSAQKAVFRPGNTFFRAVGRKRGIK